MINSDKAGVVFSVNPNTNENEIIIEASYGLGDAVVSGSISPDQYIIDKKDMRIKDIKVNKKEWMLYRDSNTGRTTKRILNDVKAESQVLTEEEINKLARLAINVEDYYQNPQDIEFAIENQNIFLVQTRPITTIEKIEEKKELQQEAEGDTILKGIPASPGVGSGKVKIVHSLEDLNRIEQGDILVAKMTNPDYVTAMQKASAIVTDEGGTSSHAAIVSREMGIPAIVGTKEATTKLSEGQEITVDGTKGEVFPGLSEEVTPKETFEIPTEIPETKTKIKVNLDMPHLAEKSSMLKPDGIGLMRMEFMIADSKIHPMKYIKENRDEEYTQMLIKDIENVIKYFKEKPVWIRTSDIRTDEYRDLEGGENEPKESNPMMGIHGIRKGLREPRLLKAELKAIKSLREKGYNNLAVMLPMVSHIEQIEKTKEILNELNMDIDLGVMIETPAACFIIHEICKDERIKFVSIGSNDLTQFTLAVDRNNSEVQDLYNEMHPSVLRLIKKVVKTAQNYNVESSICGQAGSNENMAKYLTEIGINSISVNLDSVNKIRNLVSEIEKSGRSEPSSSK